MNEFDREELLRLLDGDLDADRRFAVEAALSRDPAAQRELELLRGVDRLLDQGLPHAFPRQTPRAAFAGRVGDSVRRVHRRGRLIRAAVGWSAAASVFFAVVLGVPKHRAVESPTPRIATLVDADDGDYGRLEAAMYDFEDF